MGWTFLILKKKGCFTVLYGFEIWESDAYFHVFHVWLQLPVWFRLRTWWWVLRSSCVSWHLFYPFSYSCFIVRNQMLHSSLSGGVVMSAACQTCRLSLKEAWEIQNPFKIHVRVSKYIEMLIFWRAINFSLSKGDSDGFRLIVCMFLYGCLHVVWCLLGGALFSSSQLSDWWSLV